MDAGLIMPGLILDCDIRDLDPRSLRKTARVHLFAGVGGWDYALTLAGWPRDRPVWTCSCPCQPFSGAGQRASFDDPRHLWPQASRLLRVRRPAVLFGEQVASPFGKAWLDLVLSDLENHGYACGAVIVPAAGVGAPHGRHRTFFVADAAHRSDRNGNTRRRGNGYAHDGGASGLADAGRQRRQQDGRGSPGDEEAHGRARWNGGEPHGDHQFAGHGATGGLADADGGNASAEGLQRGGQQRQFAPDSGAGWLSALDGFWRDADWLFCRDNKWRPIEPGSFPLAHGAPARVGRLRAYGNAIVPQIAAEFVKAYLDAVESVTNVA
jgi:DNA (cytosine-5)-methyltransferase 1